MKTIQLVSGRSIDYSSTHIQRKETEQGVRTLCGKVIAHANVKPVKRVEYDPRKVRDVTTVRELRQALASDCISCLRLETGFFKRPPAPVPEETQKSR